MTLKYLLEKEFKQLFRNRIMMGMIIGFPAMLLFVFPWAVNLTAKNIRIDIVNQDMGSRTSQQLMNKIYANESFIANDYTQHYREAYDNIENTSAAVVLVIPKDFEKDLLTRHTSSVQIMANAVDGSQAGQAVAYLQQIISEFNQELLAQTIGVSPEKLVPIDLNVHYVHNPHLDYKRYLLPGFIVIILTMVCGIMPAINIVQEKEVGTIQQINVTPIRRHTFILSKIIPFWIIGLLIFAESVLALWGMYGFLPSGSLLTATAVTFLFVVSISGFGILIANFSETNQQAMFLILFFILILYLLSGLFTPVAPMPGWAKFIAYINPLTYFIQIMRMIYLKGAGFMDVIPQTMILFGFGLLLNFLAIITMKKRN